MKKHQKILLVLVALVSSFIIAVVLVKITRTRPQKVVVVQNVDVQNIEPDTPQYMDHPSKCYSCERQLGEENAWQGQKTKCFSCEQSKHIETPYDAHPIRYY